MENKQFKYDKVDRNFAEVFNCVVHSGLCDRGARGFCKLVNWPAAPAGTCGAT